MDSFTATAGHAAAVGIGATAVLDAWLALLKRLGVQGLDFALIGRWVGHIPRGRWRHDAIGRAEPVTGEVALGWLAHYGVGIAFALALVALAGPDWLAAPTPAPAIALGVATVAAPWFVMQPAMGAGIAASRTPRPLANRLRSLGNHAIFGQGLFISASLLLFIERNLP